MDLDFLTNGMIVFTATAVCLFSGAYVFLSGKKHGRSALLRKVTFRCVAAVIMSPNWVFRLGVAMVSIGTAFTVLYRGYLHAVPDGVKLVVLAGMSLTVFSSAGLALVRVLTRIVRQYWSVTIQV